MPPVKISRSSGPLLAMKSIQSSAPAASAPVTRPGSRGCIAARLISEFRKEQNPRQVVESATRDADY